MYSFVYSLAHIQLTIQLYSPKYLFLQKQRVNNDMLTQSSGKLQKPVHFCNISWHIKYVYPVSKEADN